MDELRRLHEITRENALRHPRDVFVAAPSGESLDYGALWEKSSRLAHWLSVQSFEKGARIVLVARNHWLFFPLLVACSLRNHILVPVDPALHTEELRSILSHCEPSLVIARDDLDVPAGRIPVHKISDVVKIAAEAAPPEGTTTAVDAPSDLIMIYSSGTTGSAKGILLSEKNLVWSAHSLMRAYSPTQHDRFYCFLPTFHMNAVMLTGMLPLLAGARVDMAETLNFQNAKFFWETLSSLGTTVCSLVPSVMALLLELFPDGAGVPLSVKYAFCGTAPLPEDLWRRFEKHFGFPVYQGYGLTETTIWATAVPPGEPRKYRTVGLPLDCEIRIQPLHGAPTGEILIRGANVMSCYYGNPRLTELQFTRDGFFRTGDLGYLDAEGYLHVTGRIKEIIIRNGINISGRDIDSILETHPAVKECKTIGIPDPLLGERVHTVCVLKPDTTNAKPDELMMWLQSRISGYKRPDALSVMGFLPRGASGKVSMNILRKIVTGELSLEILETLNRKKLRRCHPSDPDGIRARIQGALMTGAPLSFLSYWGCGGRDHVSETDRLALKHLHEVTAMAGKIPELPARLTLLLMDVHSGCNGVAEEKSKTYFTAIKEYAGTLGVECVYESDLWKVYGLDLDAIDRKLARGDLDSLWSAFPLRQKLIVQASKHYLPGGDFESAARRHFMICSEEKPHITKTYAQSIFMTFNGAEMRPLLPDLPTLHLFSYRKGVTVKPWFTESHEF